MLLCMDQSLSTLQDIASYVRRLCLLSTTEARSGHLTSSLSAVEIGVALFFGILRYDFSRPDHPNNDRFILSKGHATPLLYSLWTAAGAIDEKKSMTLRKIGSNLAGHPTPEAPWVDIATGSLGQGLSVGVGMALHAKKIAKLPYRVYVLLGDGEMAEGSVWEAMSFSSHHRLDNLTGIVDINRIGQSDETMLCYDIDTYEKRISAFGWDVLKVDGHDMEKLLESFHLAQSSTRPTMILAKTTKGKGVSFLEDKNGLHGVPLSQNDAKKALEEIGGSLTKGEVQLPEEAKESERVALSFPQPSYSPGDLVATRRAYGDALCALAQTNQFVVGLDADVKNSTYAETMKSKVPERFFDMYIAEQNMVGVAMGLSTRGNIPFVSTFGCFHERAVDQWRIAVISGLNIKGCGSHAGVSIGEDGPTQMALEDMAIFSSFQDSVVLYPSDATSTYQLVGLMAKYVGPMYIRTTRPKTPVLYDSKEDFVVGGSKVLRTSGEDVVTIVAAGITVFEALKAYETLLTEGIHIRVIDAYSVKPIT